MRVIRRHFGRLAGVGVDHDALELGEERSDGRVLAAELLEVAHALVLHELEELLEKSGTLNKLMLRGSQSRWL